MVKHNQHHKKMDNKIPVWLYFALHNYQGKFVTKNPLKIAYNVLNALKKHYESRKKIGLGIEWKPNNYDCANPYGRCCCSDCYK